MADFMKQFIRLSEMTILKQRQVGHEDVFLNKGGQKVIFPRHEFITALRES